MPPPNNILYFFPESLYLASGQTFNFQTLFKNVMPLYKLFHQTQPV